MNALFAHDVEFMINLREHTAFVDALEWSYRANAESQTEHYSKLFFSPMEVKE